MPGYLKPTFSTQRNANGKVLQLQSMLGSLKHMKGSQDQTLLSLLSKQDTYTKSGMADPLAEKILTKTKREQEIDDKIERLLIAYKEKDEQSQKKVSEI